MKKIIVLLIIASLLAACGGSGKSNVNDVSDEINWDKKSLCVRVFLGYGKDFSSIAGTEKFKAFSERFPSLKQVTEFTVEAEGDEVYYIIPRHKDATVAVHDYKFDIERMEGTIGKELYSGGNEPILVRCNISDIHQNTSVTVTGNGKSVTFHPASGEGWIDVLLVDSDGMYQDLDPEPVENPTDYYPDYFESYEHAGVRAKITGGKVVLHFNRQNLDGVLQNEEVLQALEDRPYIVEGLSGACKGVFIGDVGQDINPVLACLLEDGGVEVLEIGSALLNYDFRTSGRMPGYENIVSITNECAFDVIDGDSICSYVTLFATDDKGVKKEIDFCTLIDGKWEYLADTQNGEMCHLLEFTDDWKMSFRSGFPNSEALEFFSGRFWKVEEQQKGDDYIVTYHYEMKEVDRSEMTGIQPDKTIRKGVFKVKASYMTDYYDLICTSGLRFYPEKLGTKIRFERKRTNN